MLVVKKDPSWFPAENPNLKVGETIEVTDPEYLIKKGIVTLYDNSSNTIKQKSTGTKVSRKVTKKTKS